MSPEKLFDYLDGNLPAGERAQLEEKLATDPQLQRELAIAREMHQRSPRSREVLGESDDLEIPAQQNSKLGRRLLIAFSLLVVVNVLVGLAFIIGKKREPNPADLRARELAIRQQLEATLHKTAETVLPAPIIGNEVRLPGAPKEREPIANNVMLLAKQAGGSAAKAPADENGISVVIDIPSDREGEFRRSLAPLAAPDYSPPPVAEALPAGKRTIMQVRIGEASRLPQ